MTPTGSWPMIRPGRTGYSPFRIWMSVPQIVVLVTRITASPAPARGFGADSTRMSPGPWNTVARIVSVARVSVGRVSVSVTKVSLSGAVGRDRSSDMRPLFRLPEVIVDGPDATPKSQRSRVDGTPADDG